MRWPNALLAASLLVLAAGVVLGQSNPGWQTGYIPSADEWNAEWSSKQDTLGFTPLNKAGDTMTGKLQLPASTNSAAGLRLPEGQVPSSPKNGDVWTTSAGVFAQIEGSTVGPFGSGTIPSDVAYVDRNQSFTRAQRATPATLTLTAGVASPDFDQAQNFSLTLDHGTCPCTFDNPLTTPVPGQTGVIVIVQSASGNDQIATWGSEYIAAGGTSTLSLSSAANARDYFSYYVDDSTHIVISPGALNATH